MPARRKEPGEVRSKHALHVPLNAAERLQLDQLRGPMPAAVYVRGVLFGPKAAQDAPSAPTATAPLPAQPEEILVPPAGMANEWGWHMRFTPRSATVGTLSMAKPGDDWMSVDLVEIATESLPNGWLRVRYADRSLVRTEKEEA